VGLCLGLFNAHTRNELASGIALIITTKTGIALFAVAREWSYEACGIMAYIRTVVRELRAVKINNTVSVRPVSGQR
jgi:hypothetical protein